MNLLLFRPEELSDHAVVTISGRRVDHLNSVLKSKAGDTLRVGLIGGKMGDASIQAIDEKEARLLVNLDKKAPTPLDLVVMLALPRPKMLRRILRGLTEYGVKEIHLINSYRVEKSYWQSPLLQNERIEAALLEGLEQCIDTRLPRVLLEKRFRPFVEDKLPAICVNRDSLLADHRTNATFPSEPKTPGLLAIGPEGGFIPFEMELLRKTGLREVSLGPRVLRVESAIHGALGRYLGR